MSADRIYCFRPQRVAVEQFLHDVGGLASSLHAIEDGHQLQGLDHVTFIVIDGHQPIPQAMWDMIVERGAIVIHVDAQYARAKAIKLAVRHHPGSEDRSPFAGTHGPTGE
jgi:hypothetical protein